MLDRPSESTKTTNGSIGNVDDVNGFRRRVRRPKPSSYSKDAQKAEQRRLEAEARQKVREKKEKDRRAMAKARRPDKDGKYRLGRQSKVLLNRVKQLVAE